MLKEAIFRKEDEKEIAAEMYLLLQVPTCVRLKSNLRRIQISSMFLRKFEKRRI